MNAIRFLSVAMVGLFLASCQRSESRIATVPVSGQLLRGAAPLAHASVVFHSDAAAGDFPKPRATTDADGRFTLTTFDTADGAPVGTYRISVELWVTPRPDAGPTNALPAKFAKPETSGLSATVQPGTNTLAPTVLK